MSDVATTVTERTPQAITSRLAALRRRILTWLLVDGLSKLILLLIAMAVFDLLVDYLFRLDVPQRAIMLALMAIAAAIFAYFWVIRPLRHRPNDDALCLQVEAKNRNLQQVMISSLQFSRRDDWESQGVSTTMVAATITQGAQAAATADFGGTLRNARFRLALTVLLLGLAAILGVAIGVQQGVPFLKIWFDRNIMLRDDVGWPQSTYLVIEGVRDDGTLLLTRGEDHTQIVTVREDSKVIPEKVMLEFRDGGARSMQEMSSTGNLDGREFQKLFRNVSSRFKFRALCDGEKTMWVQVELVEPPAVQEISLKVVAPEYTALGEYELPSGRGPYDVIKGSGLAVTGSANKELAEAALRAGGRRWPLNVTSGSDFALSIAPDELVSGTYEFEFTDVEGLSSTRPDSFSLQIKDDRAPRVRAAKEGVSGLVVPRAIVPLKATAQDDFAIAKMVLVYEWRGVEGDSVPQTGEIVLDRVADYLGLNEVPFDDYLDLEPLRIPEGAGLRFSIQATDNCAIDGPNVSNSQEILLRVVSEEELRTDLLRREKEQRQELERLLKNQEQLLTEISSMFAAIKTNEQPLDELAQTYRGDLLTIMRQQKVIGTNVAGVATRFEAFLEEVQNNRLDEETGRLQARLRDKIIYPLRDLDEYDIQDSIRGLELTRRSLTDQQQLETALKETVDTQQQIVDRMTEILAFMVKAEGYQEAINLLHEIRKAEEEVHRLTKKRREERIRALLEQGGQGGQGGDDNSGSGDDDDDRSNDDSNSDNGDSNGDNGEAG